MTEPDDEAAASRTERVPTEGTLRPVDDARPGGLDRRTVLRRLAATSALAWVAPQVVATDRASAMAQSGCYTEYNFDDGTLQGWTETGRGPSRWQVSGLHSVSGAYSLWFGRARTADSLHPVPGQPSYSRATRPSLSTITSPATTASSTDIICFQVRLAIESDLQYDQFRLMIVQGTRRVELWNKHDLGLIPIPYPGDPDTPRDLYTTQGGWREVNVTIGTPSDIELTEPVSFAFEFETVDGEYNQTEGVYLDNIMLPCGGGATSQGTESGGGSNGSGLGPPGRPPRGRGAGSGGG